MSDSAERTSEMTQNIDEENLEILIDDLSEQDIAKSMRIVEAVLFAAEEPLDVNSISPHLPSGYPIGDLLAKIEIDYKTRGVQLKKIGRKYAFRTADDLSDALQKHIVTKRKLSRAGLETLAIIAYHQPVTRAEIEDIRGVSVSKGTLDVLLETGWVKLRGRRKVPGRPVTYGTSDDFLSQFGLEALSDLPGIDELKAAGLLDNRLPPGFSIPEPNADLNPDEDLLDADDTGAEFLDHEPLEMDLPDEGNE